MVASIRDCPKLKQWGIIHVYPRGFASRKQSVLMPIWIYRIFLPEIENVKGQTFGVDLVSAGGCNVFARAQSHVGAYILPWVTLDSRHGRSSATPIYLTRH